jgi:DNA repair exonuclease SbcCD ATPase subunit
MASAWLEQFCARAGLPADVSVEQGLTDLKKVEKAMASAKARLQALEGELLALEKQGFSAAQLEEIDLHLHRLGYQIDIGSDEALDLVISKLNSELTGFTRMLETELQLADALRRSLQADLGEDEPDIQNFRNALSELNERLVWTNNIRTRLSQFLLSFPWPAGGPIAELAVEAESIRKVAADLQTALNRERQARTSQAETIKRKDELEKSLVALRARIQRFADAYFVLKDLHDNYSLSAAMEAALRQNRVSIEKIFAQIHSPAEFQGLGSKVDTLVRKGNGDEAALSQISTGQRAAFALSIFLAQNAQLSAAPPIILIDDPIAHVDDLNSLSFLDYLREIALTGRRQIFFATAKDKLATLFERKFDFWALTNFAGTTYVEMRA